MGSCCFAVGYHNIWSKTRSTIMNASTSGKRWEVQIRIRANLLTLAPMPPIDRNCQCMLHVGGFLMLLGSSSNILASGKRRGTFKVCPSISQKKSGFPKGSLRGSEKDTCWDEVKHSPLGRRWLHSPLGRRWLD